MVLLVWGALDRVHLVNSNFNLCLRFESRHCWGQILMSPMSISPTTLWCWGIGRKPVKINVNRQIVPFRYCFIDVYLPTWACTNKYNLWAIRQNCSCFLQFLAGSVRSHATCFQFSGMQPWLLYQHRHRQSPSLCKGHKIQVREEEEQVCADISLCAAPRSFHEKRKSKNISNIAPLSSLP